MIDEALFHRAIITSKRRKKFMNNTQDRAKEFLDFHRDTKVLILPNAWDVISAKLYENLGFKAIGTTSAGIAATLGYPDGQMMSLNENLTVCERIISKTSLPVSVDIEAGYSVNERGVVNAARRVLDIGGVGINLEDSTGNHLSPLFGIDEQVKRIRAIREMSDKNGVHLFINIRCDVFMVGKGNQNEKFNEAVLRANSYKEAGADCIFIPDIGDFNEKIISELVKEIKAPLNLIAGPNIPPIQKLEEIGVARLSFGPRPMRTILSLLCDIHEEVLNYGTYNLINNSTLTYDTINNLLTQKLEQREL